MQGTRLLPVMADDLHSVVSTSGAVTLGGSWSMIGAEKLDYASVIDAMERGDLYSSCGPQIHSLTWDGEKLRLTCSPVERIAVVTQTRFAACVPAGEGKTVTEAEIDMSRWLRRSKDPRKSFLRLILTAPAGTYAVTRAYWLDELE